MPADDNDRRLQGHKGTRIDLVGIYPVEEAAEPCHLVELIVRDANLRDLARHITQDWPGRAQSDWQVAYDEHFLSEDGTAVLHPRDPGSPPPGNDARLAFFFHYLDLGRPLITPAGDLVPPNPTPRPERLNFMIYEPPC